MQLRTMLSILTILLIATAFVVPVHAKNQLTQGTIWSLKGDYTFRATDVYDAGTYSETGHNSRKFIVTSVSDTVLNVTMTYENDWSCVASSGGSFLQQCKTTSGHDSSSWDYTVSIPGMKIIATTANKQYIGHLTWFLINPELVNGGSIQMGWWTPTSNFKNNMYTDVAYQVSTQPVSIQGVSLTAWNVSHTGQELGYFSSDEVYARGPESDSYLYDPLYGTLIGISNNQTANYPGGWNERYVGSEGLVDSTLSFQPVQTTQVTTQSSTSQMMTSQSSNSTQSSSSQSGGQKCLIATSTFGSELSPEVQLLRNFRDSSILKTRAGSSFMIAFNAWYYSFSPTVATCLLSHGAERLAMRILLYPFIEIIWLSSTVFKVFRSSPELAAVLSGLLASSLIGTVYVGLPSAVLLSRVRRLRGVRSGSLVLRILSFSLLGGFGALATGELTANISLTIF
ncbi:MAG: CFI-box-CTERM domain-containing protein, partial [Candidatus Bathyarchaeia archaeon]